MRIIAAAATLGLVFVGLSVPADGQAAMNRMRTNIPPEALAPALRSLAKELNFQIVFASKDVASLRTHGAVGVFTPTEALGKVLSGTGMTFRYVDARTLTVLPIAGAAPASPVVEPSAPGTSAPSQDDGKEGKKNSSPGFRSAQVDQGQAPGTAPVASPNASPASSNALLEQVIVTATRRSESIQNVPMSISAVSQADLQNSGATQVADVVHMVPGLAYTENSVGQAILSMRGIQTSALTSNVQQPVEIYYDDVPILDLTIPWTVPPLELFDVNRVEVLRGPQGTLFGAGSLSGALRIITNKPDLSEYHAAIEDTVSTTDGGGVGGAANVMVNLPLVPDQFAVRGVYYYDYTPGWIDNPTLGERRTNHAKVSGGRVEAEWKPVDNLQLMATAGQEVTQPHDSNYVPYGSDSDIADNRVRNYNTDDLKIFNLAGSYSMPWATLTSSTSYLDRTATSSLDFSGEASELTGLTAIAPLIDKFHTDDFLQEVRLASSREHPFKWLVGVFLENYNFNDCETITQAGVSGLGYSSNYLESICIHTRIADQAGFAEASYDLLPGLTLTAGARYSRYSIRGIEYEGLNGTDLFDGPPSTATSSAVDSAVTPKVSLSYKLNEEAMVYVLADKGFRSGNANLGPAIDPFTGLPLPTSYQPDQLWNYEAGAKMTVFNRLRINADVFYIDWKKIQLQVRAPVSGIPYTDNAGTATSKGVEIQMVGKPTKSTEVGSSLAYTDARLISVSPGVAAKVGDRLPGSAPFTAYVYGQYDFPAFGSADLSLRADYSFIGREFSDLDNKDNPAALTYGDYSAIGAQAALHVGRYEFTLFGSNLANSRKRVAARDMFPEVDEVLQTPRTFGATLRAAW